MNISSLSYEVKSKVCFDYNNDSPFSTYLTEFLAKENAFSTTFSYHAVIIEPSINYNSELDS